MLYPAPIRDVLLQLAVSHLFRARWTEGIHREWIEALTRNEPHRDRSKLERTRDKMNHATRDALITGYESHIPALELPDPDDRHVLAAAIVGRCAHEYLAVLERQGLVGTVAELRQCAAIL